jgi:hypothetical protein
MYYRKLSILVTLSLLTISGFALLSSRANLANSTLARNSSTPVHEPQASANTSPRQFRSGRLLPGLHFAFKALGDRLQQPGKERVTMTGVLRGAEEPQPIPFTLISELPGRLRLTMQRGISQRSLIFDGQRATSNDGTIDQKDLAILEMLIYDTADRFFLGQMEETSPRFLGAHFRADDGSTADYQGPFYDIYQVTESVKSDPTTRRQAKLYCFNSETQLLERVRYRHTRNGSPVEVEIQIDDWRSTQAQQIPRRITRLENNSPVVTLTIASAMVTPRVADGVFGTP